jgi:hypothetical protein
MLIRTPALVAAATLAAACALTGTARAGTVGATCGEGTYAYAGMGGREIASGVSATIVPTAAPTVRSGHVDGWVGVGGPGMGPRGTDEWIQVGLTSVPDEAQSSVYYEIVRPGHGDVTRELRHVVRVGEVHTFAVRELAGRPSWWRVWMDGKPASAPVYLPASHGRWTAQAVGESWAGTTSGPCNAYAYGFSNVTFASARDGVWNAFRRFQPFQSANYLLVRRSATSFLARSVLDPTRVAATLKSERGGLTAAPVSQLPGA